MCELEKVRGGRECYSGLGWENGAPDEGALYYWRQIMFNTKWANAQLAILWAFPLLRFPNGGRGGWTGSCKAKRTSISDRTTTIQLQGAPRNSTVNKKRTQIKSQISLSHTHTQRWLWHIS